MRYFTTANVGRLAALVLALGVGVVAGQRATAAEPLAWKFERGLVLRYQIVSETTTTIDLGVGGQVDQQATNTIDLVWTVESVDEQGAARIQSRIARMRLSIGAAGAPAVQYDSQSKDEPQGFAAMIAPLGRELTRAEFTLTMTPLGAITEVDVPEALVEVVAASPGAAMLGDMATAEGFKKLVGRSPFELPAKLEPGAESKTTAVAHNPLIGEQTTTTTYRYEGPRTVQGATLEAFRPTVEVALAGGSSNAHVTRQATEGEALFNRDAGRLESALIDQTMTLALTFEGKELEQQLRVVTSMKRQAEEGAAPSP